MSHWLAHERPAILTLDVQAVDEAGSLVYFGVWRIVFGTVHEGQSLGLSWGSKIGGQTRLAALACVSPRIFACGRLG